VRIVHVGPAGSIGVQPTGAGGIEKAVYFLARYQGEMDNDVHVIDIKADVHKKLSTRIHFHEVRLPPFKDKGVVRHLIRAAFFCLGMVLTLRRLERQKKIDIIHTHQQFPLAAALAAKKLLRWKTPIIHTVHNPWILYTDRGHRLGNIFETSALKRVEHVTMPTEYIQRELIRRFGIAPARTSRVYYGINTEDILQHIHANPREAKDASDRRDKIVFCAARIQPRKNQMAVVRAVPEVLAACPEARFVFSGPFDDPDYHREMMKFVEDKRLKDRVEFTGQVSQETLYDLYQKATIFVFPTLYEIQPVAVPEAMAFGLPVAASRIGPIQDIVSLEKDCALLFDPADTGEIAGVIIRLLRDETLRRELAARGRKLAYEKFTWEESAREMLKIYERIVQA
jgi:glycosyltransferase involved in cell wall biosynthesis